MKNKILLTFMALTLVFAGCSNGEKQGETASEDVKIASKQGGLYSKPTEDISNKGINMLTGLYIPEEFVKRRPVAVVINNINIALPQSGIGQADIVYEVLAEADITRLIAIFKDFDSEKVGPVRSTRHYFSNFAIDYDAIFVHHGGSPLGYKSLESMDIDHLDGMVEDNIFYRDPERVSVPGMFEHSSYTNYKGIMKGIEEHNFKSVLYEDFQEPFQFYATQTSPENSIFADKIIIPFSGTYISVFEYDKTTKLYKKYNALGVHIDEEMGKQLEFSNIIIQNVNIYKIASDEAGRREVGLVGKGTGYLVTDGKYVPIFWEKDSENSETEWHDEAGNKLNLNKGKTYIAVNNMEPSFENEKMTTTTTIGN